MVPFTVQPVVIPQSGDERSWQERTDDEVAGQPINAATFARIDNLRHELAVSIECTGGILSASDDQLLALLKLSAYGRQCIDAGVTRERPAYPSIYPPGSINSDNKEPQ